MTSYIIYAVVLIIAGILAAPSLILSKKPNAQEILDKITPYQGFIGILVFIWGIWDIIEVIRSIGLLSYGLWGILIWLLILAIGIVELGLGFLLGFGLLNKYVLSKNAEAEKKGQETLAKIVPYQGKLGLAGIILGILLIVVIILA